MDSKKVIHRKSQRSRVEVAMDFLEAIQDGANNKTTVMRRANLEWYRMHIHIQDLKDKEWIVYDGGYNSPISITDKGLKVLRLWREIQRNA